MWALRLASALLFVLGTSSAFHPNEEPLLTSTGLVRGFRLPTKKGDVNAFLGIPFAEPPVGNLRFKKPQPKKPWDGVYEATTPPVLCAQSPVRVNKHYQITKTDRISEDCLLLNIFAPTNNDSLHAVVLYLHGGGFSFGGLSLGLLDTSVLSAFGNVVTVAVAYRLGAFGFLNLGIDDAPGNMAFYDQLLAMEWVKKNIRSFGGDPDKITLMGQSAGSLSVGMHLISPKSKGLFKRAIMQSGNPFTKVIISDKVQARLRASTLASALGCETEGVTVNSHPEKVVSCLRSKDVESILDATRSFGGDGLDSFFPVFGDEFVPERTDDALKNGHYNAVDVMAGLTEAEGDFFVQFFTNSLLNLSTAEGVTKSQVRVLVKVMLSSLFQVNIKPVLDHYLKSIDQYNSDKLLQAGGDLLGDLNFNCPTTEFAKKIQDKNSTVYIYKFSLRPSFGDWPNWVRTTHADDIFYSLGSMYKVAKEFTDVEVRCADGLMQAIATFSETGVPKLPENVEWPKFGNDGSYMEIGPKGFVSKKDLDKSQCQFWNEVIQFT